MERPPERWILWVFGGWGPRNLQVYIHVNMHEPPLEEARDSFGGGACVYMYMYICMYIHDMQIDVCKHTLHYMYVYVDIIYMHKHLLQRRHMHPSKDALYSVRTPYYSCILCIGWCAWWHTPQRRAFKNWCAASPKKRVSKMNLKNELLIFKNEVKKMNFWFF